MPGQVPVERTLTVYPLKGMHTLEAAQNVPDGASPDMFNFQVYRGYIRKRPGYTPYQAVSNFPTPPITGIVSVQSTEGARNLFVTNPSGLYKYNTATADYDLMTGPALTGSALDLFAFEVSQNNLVFCQGVDNIMALPLTGNVYAEISSNSQPTHFLSRWNGRLYTAFTVEGGMNDPFRVRWPVNGDHTDWVGVGSGFNDLTDEIYQLQNIKKLLDTLVVYAERSITLATKTGNSLGPATFALQVKDVGLASPFTLQAFNTLHFFLGTDNLYVFQGTTVVPIGDSCRATIFNQLNPNQLPFNFALLLYESQEYACFVATGGNTTTDTAWVYNFQRQCLYPWKFANPRFTCGAIHYLDSSVTIGALSGTIAEQTWVIGSFTLSANFPIPVLGGSTGEVFTLTPGVLSDNGHPIPCRWTSKDYTAKDIDPSLGNDMITLREVGLEYVDPGTAFTLQFYFSIDRGKSWSGPFPITVGGGPVGSVGDTMCTRQVTGRRIRFKVENTTINELPQIQSFSPTLELRRQKVT